MLASELSGVEVLAVNAEKYIPSITIWLLSRGKGKDFKHAPAASGVWNAQLVFSASFPAAGTHKKAPSFY